jgi:hypothetical protein
MPSKVVAMDIGSDRVVRFNVKEDVITRFGIVEDTAEPKAILRARKAHTRSLYDASGAARSDTVNVERSTWYDISGGVADFGAGKAIKIPLGFKTAKGIERYTTIRIPAKATNFAIASWIDKKFVRNKPNHFITPNGRRYPTNVPTVADLNPGEDNTPPPAP